MQAETGHAAPPLPTRRDEFRVLREITTRWMDNDQYGHVNNVVYYSYFDTAVNGYLIEASGCDVRKLLNYNILATTLEIAAAPRSRTLQGASPASGIRRTSR